MEDPMEIETPAAVAEKIEKPATVAEKIAKAKEHKDAGNKYFEKEEWQKALTEYCHALLYVKGLGQGGLSGMTQLASMMQVGKNIGGEAASAHETQDLTDLQKTVNLNMAAVHIKLQKYERAIEECTQVLTLDKNHAKALFRRGQAHLALNDYYKAKEDLEAADKLTPNNKPIKKELEKIIAWEKKEDERAKGMYQKMF